MTQMTEYKWVWIVAIIAVVFVNLPFAFAAITAPHGTVYTGVSSVAPGDLNVYLSYLEQVRQGHFVMKDLFTPEPQVATLINPFWLVLGLLGSVLHLAPLATYLLARIGLGVLLIFVLYRFITFFYDDKLRRRAALLLAVFASGVGAWIEPILRAVNHGTLAESGTPMDLWVSEAFTFLSLRHSPHFLAVTILIVTAIWLMIRSAERSSLRDSVYAGLALLGLFSFHPFHVVSFAYITVGFLVSILAVRRRSFFRQLGRFGIMWLMASPAVMYHVLLVLYDPLAKGRSLQNILPTTTWWLTIVSYGLLLVAAIFGATMLFRAKRFRSLMLVTWAIAHAASIYAPVFFNRRVTHGLNVALALCAAAAAPMVLARISRMRLTERIRTPLFAVLAFLLFSLSNIWVVAQDYFFLFKDGRIMPSFFYMADDYRGAFSWLEKNGNDTTIVLSGTISGNFIPGRSGRTVYAGHNVETIAITEKLANIRTFYMPETEDSWRLALLADNKITHVLVGPREKARGAFTDPAKVPSYLVPVYSRDAVALYRVVR